MCTTKKSVLIKRLKVLLCLGVFVGFNVCQAQEIEIPKLPSQKLEAQENSYFQQYQTKNRKFWRKYENSELEDEEIMRFYPNSLIYLLAKAQLFDDCQQDVVIYVSYARSNHTSGLSYEELAPGQAAQTLLDFPFSVVDSQDSNGRIMQMVIELAYKNKNRGEATVDDFFKQCMALPLEAYIE